MLEEHVEFEIIAHDSDQRFFMPSCSGRLGMYGDQLQVSKLQSADWLKRRATTKRGMKFSSLGIFLGQ
jgi:hypothetical protein